MQFSAHELLANCTKIADLISADGGFHAKLIEEYRSLQACAAAENNSGIAAQKLAHLLQELLRFGDNLTEQQRVMIRAALNTYQPQQEDYNV